MQPKLLLCCKSYSDHKEARNRDPWAQRAITRLLCPEALQRRFLVYPSILLVTWMQQAGAVSAEADTSTVKFSTSVPHAQLGKGRH